MNSHGRTVGNNSTVVAYGIRYGLCRYSHNRKGSFLDFQKRPFSDLIWRGTKVDLSRLRRTLRRLLRNSCCRLVASLLRSLNLVFCLPYFSLIKNSLSFWVASMYVSYAVPLYRSISVGSCTWFFFPEFVKIRLLTPSALEKVSTARRHVSSGLWIC